MDDTQLDRKNLMVEMKGRKRWRAVIGTEGSSTQPAQEAIHSYPDSGGHTCHTNVTAPRATRPAGDTGDKNMSRSTLLQSIGVVPISISVALGRHTAVQCTMGWSAGSASMAVGDNTEPVVTLEDGTQATEDSRHKNSVHTYSVDS
ncbi:hypothetical protein Bbelb_095110 [Branchiostoma belcheri]|nr:hypothetical protein Bbelb_095110 [Branchiostoma belcheri]